MTLEELTDQVRLKVGIESRLGATVKFVFEDGSVIFIDGSSTPNEISNEDKGAECVIRITRADFEAMGTGELDGTTAFMTGKLKVEGDMAIAMKLSSVL